MAEVGGIVISSKKKSSQVTNVVKLQIEERMLSVGLPAPNGIALDHRLVGGGGGNQHTPMSTEKMKGIIGGGGGGNSVVAVDLGGGGGGGATDSDLRLRGTSLMSNKNQNISDIIKSFKKPHFTLLSKCLRELRSVFKDRRAKRSLYLIAFNLISTFALFNLCNNSKSIAFLAYTYLSVLDLFILLTCPLSVWVEQQRPTPSFTFGYGRLEVLAVFSCTVLANVGAILVFKGCIDRLLLPEQPNVAGTSQLTGIVVALLCQLVVIYGMDSKAWTHVVRSSNSSCLQVRLTELSENLCQFMPGLSRFLLPRINPFVLLANSCAFTLIVAHLLIEIKNYQAADAVAAGAISFLTWITMFPMCVHTGMILLQTTPSHVLSHLEKCLREAATLDGVLEFRNEHFWMLSFGVMAGSLHVRVRRDANEQLVLAHLTSRLSSLIHELTIQVFKDDWTRSATTLQLLTESSRITAASSTSPSSLSTGQWLSKGRSTASDFSTLSIFSEQQRHHQQNNPKVVDRATSYLIPRV